MAIGLTGGSFVGAVVSCARAARPKSDGATSPRIKTTARDQRRIFVSPLNPFRSNAFTRSGASCTIPESGRPGFRNPDFTGPSAALAVGGETVLSSRLPPGPAIARFSSIDRAPASDAGRGRRRDEFGDAPCPAV